ncbi:hypothetical protein ILYODFUR_024011 [Ilyodon furcidens]|uniref:Uncharacterized protein n=1 Tax=Ilyodon furcidens TaxID=33524 RepID=A0ABV0U8B1_9TELE
MRFKYWDNQKKVLFSVASQLLFFMCSSQGVASPFLSCSMAAKEEQKDAVGLGLHCSEPVSGCSFFGLLILRPFVLLLSLLSMCEGDDEELQTGKFAAEDEGLRTLRRGHSLSLVGRGFFSFVSVFFSFALSKRAISVMSGLSDILAVKHET